MNAESKNVGAGPIDLMAEESRLVSAIMFDPKAIDGHEAHRNNGDLVVQLWGLLEARSAIPERRVRYFTDPDYNIGGHGKSQQQVFEKNGCAGEAILRHAHFLPYLRYMVLGPDLPAAVVDQFGSAVEDCGSITSGDIIPLAATAKKIAREHGLGHHAREAFFQLALDLGLDLDGARSMHDAVGALR